MTDRAVPDSEGVATQSDVYLANLPERDRAIFLHSSGEPDLEADIRLLRTVIASLLDNLREDSRHFAVLFNALCRAIGLQIKSRAGQDDLEESILLAADDALQHLESEARGDAHDGKALG